MNTQTLLTPYATLLEANMSQDTPVHWVFDSAFNYFYTGELLAKQGDFQLFISFKNRSGWDGCNSDVRDVRQANFEVS
jgi:hypothetical protein